MTLQNDVLNPGPVLNQHPRKAWKSMTSRGGRPCCGGYPCRPPKMHQIGNEVVRDWSLWGSWYFCLFWWFLEIVSGFFWQEVRSFSWVLLSERCFVILLYIYLILLLFIFQIYLFPKHRTKTPGLLQLEAQSGHLQASQKRAAKRSWSSTRFCRHVNSVDMYLQLFAYVQMCSCVLISPIYKEVIETNG